MSSLQKRPLERLLHRQGQTIRSRDFRDQQAIEGQLRAWHNRALHNAYGIAEGLPGSLQVFAQTVNQKSGVRVLSGAAYDIFGRELLLRASQFLPFPPDTEPNLLVLRAGESRRPRHASESTVNVCVPSDRNPVTSDVRLSWVPARLFSVREGVALAKTKITGSQVTLDDDFVPRHS